MRSVRRVVFSLVVVLALATGCFASKETREGADKLEVSLGTSSWAQSVVVETSVSGLTDDEVVTTVVLKPDATADEIADFVLDHPDQVEDAGLGLGFADLRFEGSNGAVLAVPYAEATDEDGVRAAVNRWLAIRSLFAADSTAELSRTIGGNASTPSLAGGARPRSPACSSRSATVTTRPHRPTSRCSASTRTQGWT